MAAKDKVNQLVRDDIRALAAYHVPDPGNLVKLDAMENPYGLPDDIRHNWLAMLDQASLNRYPDPDAGKLKDVLRALMHLPETVELVLGNGSDELIQMIAMSLAKPDAVIMAPEPSFVMYQMIATFCHMRYIGVPLNDDFSLDMNAMLAAISTQQPAVIFLAYPNNPTGNLFSEADVRAIIDAANGLVVIDEAYTSFASHSMLDAIGEYDNLLVMRTVSKMGLAGLRLGMLMGAPEWLHEINKVRLPYNINILTQLTAEFLLRNESVFAEQAASICAERTRLMEALSSMPKVHPYPSEANFILYRLSGIDADAVFADLKTHGVLIKNMSHAGPALQNCMRVTVGSPDENAAFIAAIQDSLT